jgi:MSHA biogenesis protein MshP
MTYFTSPTGIRQQGFALVAAIFIIVVLAMLGVMMVTIGGIQRATTSAAVLGARAYHAARTGVEWGIHGALNNTVATCGNSPSPPNPPTTNNFNLSVNGLNGFTVTVVCGYTEHRELNNPYNIYVITATATFGAFGSDSYVSRTLRTTVTDAPPP